MKTNKILLGAALFAGLFAVAACGETTPTTTPATPTTTAPTVQAVAEFKGSTTIEDVTYNVVLSLYADKTLTLTIADGIDPVNGSYEFVEGKGYTLTIGTATYETKWDAATTSHKFDYELKLGELGKGTVTLALVDEDFVLTAKSPKVEWVENAKFDGVLNFYGSHNLHLRFAEDGTYAITTDTEMAMVKGMLEETGSYTFENNTFTITTKTGTYKSVYDLHTGGYSLTYQIKGQDGNPEITLYYQPEVVFYGEASDFGGLQFHLYTYSDGTCFADITTTMESMNSMFDRSGTWTKVDGEFVFSIKTNTAEGAEPVEFPATVDEATGKLVVNYAITGDREVKAALYCAPVAFNGSVSNLGGVNFDLIFTSATEAFVDVTTTMASMNTMFDAKGTYTIVDNVITLTVGSKTFTSTFDETTGTYSLTYELVGPEYTLTPTLTFTLWGE